MRGAGQRFAAVVAVVSIVGGVSACSIQQDSEPRDIPVEQRGNFGALATGDEATGANRIYLITPADEAGQRKLRAVARGAATRPGPLLESLFAGPNEEELLAGLDTTIPAELQLITPPRTVGTRLILDVNDALNELTTEGLQLAIGQIVATVTELDGVERVRLRTFGENQAWPTSDGRLTDEVLSIYDYHNTLESSQPPFPALPSV